jgi:hypothetical protein
MNTWANAKWQSWRNTVLRAVRLATVLTMLCACGGSAQSAKQAESHESPNDVLVLARKNVETFFQQSANVVCAESITQIVLGKNDKALYREESAFEYQLQAKNESGSLKLVESRDALKTAFRDPRRTLLITNGFASMLLIIHPTYESSYVFEPAGEETVDGIRFVKIHFRSVPGGKSPAALQLRGKSYAMPLSGMIWIDPSSGAVEKLTAAVDSSLSDLGLQGMRTEIHYAVVQFHDPEESYWMPVSAVIDVETPRQHWRNVHRFTKYKRFKATIQVELEKPQQ